MPVRLILIHSTRRILIYHYDLRSRCLLMAPSDGSLFHYALRVKRPSLMLRETDHHVSCKTDPYYTSRDESMCLVNRTTSLMPSLLRNWTLYPFTYAYMLRGVDLFMALYCSLPSRELIPFLKIPVSSEDAEDTYLVLRSWFISREASWGPDTSLKKPVVPRCLNSLLEAPAF